MKTDIPIITIDGLSGSGKTTISKMLSENMRWNLLDSGKLYRAIGYLVNQESLNMNEKSQVNLLVNNIRLNSSPEDTEYKIFYMDNNISMHLENEKIGIIASQVAKLDYIRNMLLPLQHSSLKEPGLIANGRDMGTKVFPQAKLKLFFTASLEIRAQRRFEEMKNAGKNVNLSEIIESLKARDDSDINREASPLVPAKDAHTIDSSNLNIKSVLDKIYKLYTISEA
ncbi:MAG: cytidylate kinase [Gammaproteobacteria bacterium]|nr:cytidylate kinase [Gammaproteobacteria bacterium]|tara:strand:+ start:1704 stop:2381 length:678 start_codon:yes stop_codon:yes gene_type:complete